MKQFFAIEYSSGDILSVEYLQDDRIIIKTNNSIVILSSSELAITINKLQEIGSK